MTLVSHTGYRSPCRPCVRSYRGTRHRRNGTGTITTRRARLLALAGRAGPTPKTAFDLSESTYRGVAAWTHETMYVPQVQAAYDARWRTIRHQMPDPVSRAAISDVGRVMAAHADYRTGRNSRPSNARIVELSGHSLRVVQRARMAMRLLGVATEVLRGRRRTKVERIASWRVGDKSRGWASVYALHPCVLAPHPRRGRFRRPSPVFENSLAASGSAASLNGAASRPVILDKQGPPRRRKPPVHQGGAILASRWLRDDRTPRFAHRHTPTGWARTLARAADHGWSARDLNQLLDEYARLRFIVESPRNPLELVGAILKWHGDYETRPAQHDVDWELAEAAAARARVQEQAEQRAREAAMRDTWRTAGGPDRRTAWRQR